MTARVVSLTPPPDPGDTLLLDGRPHVVLHRLPKLPGRRPAVRVSADLPCGACEVAPLRYDAPRRRWWCPSCRMVYGREALANLSREHVADEPSVALAALRLHAEDAGFIVSFDP